MTIQVQSPVISSTSWIQRAERKTISGNNILVHKTNYQRETSTIPRLVANIQIGRDVLPPTQSWLGITETPETPPWNPEQKRGETSGKHFQDQRKINSELLSIKYTKMTISIQGTTISTTNWFQRNDSKPISGNVIKCFKSNYSIRETSTIPSLVSSIQLGNDVLTPTEGWNGLLDKIESLVWTRTEFSSSFSCPAFRKTRDPN